MPRRIVDWLEKTSVAAFAVGVFQARPLGLLIAMLALILSLWITKLTEEKWLLHGFLPV